jgi:outer membrane protein assembly factor BamB
VNGTLEVFIGTVDSVTSGPVIGPDGTIYFGTGSNDGHFYAVGRAGNIKWKFHAGWDILSSPALDDEGNIYLGITHRTGEKGYIVSLDSEGEVLWDHETRDWIESSILLTVNDTIVVCDLKGWVYCLTPNGSLLWELQTPFGIRHSPSSDRYGNLYLSTGMYLHSYDPFGSFRWEMKLNQSDTSSPVILDDDSLMIVDSTGKVNRIGLSGDLIWTSEIGWGSISNPVFMSDGSILVGRTECHEFQGPVVDYSENIIFGSGSCLYCLLANGSLKWNITVHGITAEPVIGPDGKIIIGTQHGLMIIGNDDLMWPKVIRDIIPYPWSESGTILLCMDQNGNVQWEFESEGVDREVYYHGSERKDKGIPFPTVWVMVASIFVLIVIFFLMRSESNHKDQR